MLLSRISRCWTRIEKQSNLSTLPILSQTYRCLSSSKVPIELDEKDLDESFVKGSGKGGQKINKVRNCVLLKHYPTGIVIRCQKTRSLDDNRRVARKLLKEKLDHHYNGADSTRSQKIDKLRKKKAKKHAKAKKKHSSDILSDDETEDGQDATQTNLDNEETKVDEWKL